MIDPFSEYTKALAKKLEDKYGVAVLPTDCAHLDLEDIDDIFSKICYMNFQLKLLILIFLRWIDDLPDDHWLKQELYSEIQTAFTDIHILKQVDTRIQSITKYKNYY